MPATGLHDSLCAAVLLSACDLLPDEELLRAGHELSDQLLRRMQRVLPAGRLPADVLSATVPVLPGAELGAALLPGAGDQLPSMLVLGAGHDLLCAACADLLPYFIYGSPGCTGV